MQMEGTGRQEHVEQAWPTWQVIHNALPLPLRLVTSVVTAVLEPVHSCS